MQHTTKTWRAWSDEALAALRELAAEGLPLAAICHQIRARFGHSVRGTEFKIYQLGGVKALRGPRQFRMYSRNQAAKLLGVHYDLVSRWVNEGVLEATRYRRRRKHERHGGPQLLISDAAIVALLSVEEAWPAYDPANITDPDLRAEAARLRAEAGGGWVRVADLMRQGGYCAENGYRYLAAYAGPKRTTKWRTHTYLWAAHAPAFLAWLREPRGVYRRAA